MIRSRTTAMGTAMATIRDVGSMGWGWEVRFEGDVDVVDGAVEGGLDV